MNHQNKVQDQCQQVPGFVPGSGAGAMVLEDYETVLPVEQPFMPKFWVEIMDNVV
jgi:hypothetical protein